MNLKTLSDILGLSQTTVSRALNGYPEVSEATRERVRKAADQHNYAPNNRARSLATGRTHAVGHVIPVSTEHEVVNPVFTDFVAGASEIYARENYDMHLKIVPDALEEQTYRDIALKGSVDAVIIHGPKDHDKRIELLRSIGMPFVVHGRSSGEGEDDYSWVDVNNARAFERATDFLLDLGHTRISLLNGLETMDFATRRRQGYSKALAARNVPEDASICRSSEMTEEFGFNSASALLAQDNPPTAFLASSIIIGIGVRRACDDAGLKLGRDVSLVIHDDDLSYLRNGTSEPIYTATRSSVRHAGRICAEMLMTQINDPNAPHEHRMLDAELIIGHTHGPAPKA
ncbi:substrate-binding domain-containing protein [Celeribacter marinus]|uniref:Transcriptional regulator AglR, LacI family n=1 Tax=Celeribacter marinus TaxID=1397108 RepID=A0A0N9ZX13_9RHOB|nr:substrate-binding domain-containing protein [Celeribacter marinus]ALI54603.1 transcriptional regulator AglR, LacI family [Celeribacter marinus]SFK50707.1 transcriptional regulator, LacI family [Celeribacter marinus]